MADPGPVLDLTHVTLIVVGATLHVHVLLWIIPWPMSLQSHRLYYLRIGIKHIRPGGGRLFSLLGYHYPTSRSARLRNKTS